MTYTRQRFIRTLGAVSAALAGGCPLRGSATAAGATVPAFDPAREEEFWTSVRGLFDLPEGRVYLNTAGLGPVPRPVLEVVEREQRRLQAGAENGRHDWEEHRAAVASFLGAEPDEVAFTRNATEGNSIIAAGLRLEPGDEVVFESHAHPGGSFPWLNRQMLHGIRVRVFEPSAGSDAETIARLRAVVGPRTRVIQLSHVTAPTGLLLPVAATAAIAREAGAWFHLDAAQSVGMRPVAVRELGCDSLAVSGHKWLGGPHETGALWIRRERLPEVALAHAGAYSDAGYSLPDRFTYAPTARRFEWGTRSTAAVAGLAAACALQARIGPARIAARGAALAARAAAGLRELAGVEVLTPADPARAGAIVTFRFPGRPAAEVFDWLLRERGLRARPVTEEGLEAVRLSPHLFNTPAEIDATVAAVAAARRALA